MLLSDFIVLILYCGVIYMSRYGIKSFILFPKVKDNLKTNYAEESYNPAGIVPRALQMIKQKYPDVVVCTDVALDPYSSEVCREERLSTE